MSTEHGLPAYIEKHRGSTSKAELARKSGNRVSRAQISSFTTRPLTNFPDTKTLQGLIAALGRPASEVIRAVSESVGIEWEQDGDDLVIPGAGSLPQRSKDALVEMAQSMLWWIEQDRAEACLAASNSKPDAAAIDKDSEAYRAMSVEERIASAGVTEQGEVDLAAYKIDGPTMREQQEAEWAESEDQSPDDPDHVA